MSYARATRKLRHSRFSLMGLKGAVPVLLLTHFGGPQAGMIAGLAAMAGHIFPVWLDFKGGKGVATSLGVLFGLFWPLGLIFSRPLACACFRLPHVISCGPCLVSAYAAVGLSAWVQQ